MEAEFLQNFKVGDAPLQEEYKSAAALRTHVEKEHPQALDETDTGEDAE